MLSFKYKLLTALLFNLVGITSSVPENSLDKKLETYQEVNVL